MTQAEQASLDALRTEMRMGFDKIEALMETRRLEEVRVQEQLDKRIKDIEMHGSPQAGTLANRMALVEQDINEYERAKTLAEAFFSFGKWISATTVVVLGLVFTYLSLH